MLKRPSLTTQIIIGLIAGIILGAWYRESWPEPEQINPFASNMQMFSDIFMKLIKMIIAPLVFSLLLTGIAKAGDFKTVGRMGLKTLIYFTSATLVALLMGLIIVNIFEPGKEELVVQLIPKAVKVQLYKAVLDSHASEHGALMTSMSKATDNAGEILKELKLSYNKARQAAITGEILEIVAGAEALNG